MNLSQANMLVEQALSAYQSKRFADAEELWAAAPTCKQDCSILNEFSSFDSVMV
jgi:hypothetical protein